MALSVALVAPLPAYAGDRSVATTEHYEVSTGGSAAEAEEWGRVLETAWPQFGDVFGSSPKLRRGERLRVAVFEDDATWRAAIVAGGGMAPSSGGYYCPVAKTAYLKRQPTRWYTRTLLLHEAAHQFHYLGATGNSPPGADWYIEGIAEHVACHTWDGTSLRLGVVPLLSLEDRAGAALTAVAAADFGLEKLLVARPVRRPEAMHLVRFLRDGAGGAFRKRFDGLARKLDRGTSVSWTQMRRTLGDPDEFVAAWRAWLPTVQEPLVSVFVEWEARAADQLRGTGKTISICRTREPARRISARARPMSAGPWRVGVLLHFEGPDRYTVAFLTGDAEGEAAVRVDRMTAGRWTNLHQGAAGVTAEAVRADGVVVTALRGEDGVAFDVAGKRIGVWDLPGEPGAQSLGLALDHCDADFGSIVIDPAR